MSAAAGAFPAPGPSPAKRRDLRKVIGASGPRSSGTTSSSTGPRPRSSSTSSSSRSSTRFVGTLVAFATYAVGFVARPIGGIVFGHYGDRVRRRRILVLTLMIMGGAAFLIVCLPTYETIGVAAPILLVTLRFLQGLGLGGEGGGAVLMVAEHGDERRRCLNSSWPPVGVPAGNLLAAGVLALLAGVLSESAFESWGWRIPFLLSAALIGVGLWIRLTVQESPLFRELEEKGEKARAPIIDVVERYPRSLAIATCARSARTWPSTSSRCSSSPT